MLLARRRLLRTLRTAPTSPCLYPVPCASPPARPHARSPTLRLRAGRLLAGCALTCSAARLLRRPPAAHSCPAGPPLRAAHPPGQGPGGRGLSGAPTPISIAGQRGGCLLDSLPAAPS